MFFSIFQLCSKIIRQGIRFFLYLRHKTKSKQSFYVQYYLIGRRNNSSLPFRFAMSALPRFLSLPRTERFETAFVTQNQRTSSR